MKICVAQTKPVAGNIQQNSRQHQQLIDVAVSAEADVLIFPELSLTGYEPNLANALATVQHDSQFDSFQKMSDANRLTIGIGMPVRMGSDILIGLLIFQPHQPRQLYAKQHIHPDEEPYFISAQPQTTSFHPAIALAICYELSIPDHAEKAHQSGASTYIASVAKSATGLTKAVERLAEIANTYSMTVLMANSVGPSDNFIAAGQSSIWNQQGELISQLSATDLGILGVDVETQESFYKVL